MAEAVQIREMKTDEAEVCDSVLRSLPGWFGIEEAVVGFVTLNQHNP